MPSSPPLPLIFVVIFFFRSRETNDTKMPKLESRRWQIQWKKEYATKRRRRRRKQQPLDRKTEMEVGLRRCRICSTSPETVYPLLPHPLPLSLVVPKIEFARRTTIYKQCDDGNIM